MFASDVSQTNKSDRFQRIPESFDHEIKKKKNKKKTQKIIKHNESISKNQSANQIPRQVYSNLNTIYGFSK